MSTEIDEQSRRLDALERQVRRLRRLSIVFGLLIVVISAAMLMPSLRIRVDQLDARYIRISDRSGKLAAVLVGDDTGPRLNFFDSKGNDPVRLCMNHDRAALLMCDGEMKTRLWLGMAAQGPRVILADKGHSRIEVGVNDGDEHVTFWDEAGHYRLQENRFGTRLFGDDGKEYSAHSAAVSTQPTTDAVGGDEDSR